MAIGIYNRDGIINSTAVLDVRCELARVSPGVANEKAYTNVCRVYYLKLKQ